MIPLRRLAAVGGSLLLLALLLLSRPPLSRGEGKVHPVPARILSLHVVANSNSPQDQAVKMAVRDRLLPELSRILQPATGLKTSESLLRSHLGFLATSADRVLHAYGVPYRARVLLGWARYKAKAFGSLTLPAGRYQALQVLLGRARGHNWWCVLFPNLCLAPPSVAVQQSEPLPRRGGARREVLAAHHRSRPVPHLALYRGHRPTVAVPRRSSHPRRTLVNRLWNNFIRFW